MDSDTSDATDSSTEIGTENVVEGVEFLPAWER